jgi:uncharacterized DUF497 family protein
MRFEWDDQKSKVNQQKHSIAFESAALVSTIPTWCAARIGSPMANSDGTLLGQ